MDLNLNGLIGHSLWILRNGSGKLEQVKLLGVESGGLWIESQAITNAILQTVGVQTATKTPVIFLPYSSFQLAMSSVDVPALVEKAFGV